MENILILYATLTLNTEYFAKKIKDYLESHSLSNSVSIMNIEDLEEFKILEEPDLIIFGTSTWSEGDFPPRVEEKMQEIENLGLDFSKQKFFLFGLGESHYDHYCGAVEKAEEIFIKKLGGEKVGENFYIDGPLLDDYFEKIKPEIHSILKK